MNYKEYLEFQNQLSQVEKFTELINIKYEGFPLWYLLKDSLYFFLFYNFKTNTVSVIKKSNKLLLFVLNSYCNEIKFNIKFIVYKNNKNKLLFISNRNFKINKNGYWIDPFWNDILINLSDKYDSVIINYNHGEKNYKKHLAYSEFGEYFIKNPIYNLSYYWKFKNRNDIKDKLNDLIQFFEKLNKDGIIDDNLIVLLKKFLKSKYSSLKIYSILNEYRKSKKTLLLLQPKLIFITSVQGHLGIIAAAKEMHIPIIEYQHGIIDHNHPAYIYNENLKHDNRILVPNYLFLFGEYWRKILIKNNFWNDEQLHEVGYLQASYIEKKKFAPENKKNEFNVLFTAQDVFHDEAFNYLKDFLSYISIKPNNIILIIKLHPRDPEALNIYQKLYDQFPLKCKIISDNKTTIYDCFKETKYHLTAYSNSLFEALSIGIPCATIHPLGYYYFDELIAEKGIGHFMSPIDLSNYLEEISENEELYSQLKQNTSKYEDYFYKKYNLDNSLKIIDDIISKTEK